MLRKYQQPDPQHAQESPMNRCTQNYVIWFSHINLWYEWMYKQSQNSIQGRTVVNPYVRTLYMYIYMYNTLCIISCTVGIPHSLRGPVFRAYIYMHYGTYVQGESTHELLVNSTHSFWCCIRRKLALVTTFIPYTCSWKYWWELYLADCLKMNKNCN